MIHTHVYIVIFVCRLCFLSLAEGETEIFCKFAL